MKVSTTDIRTLVQAVDQLMYQREKYCPLYGDHRGLPCPCGFPKPDEKAVYDAANRIRPLL